MFSEHSYSPINVTENIGRCNFPYNPVFYCSNDPITALLEVVRNSDFKNKKYCISSWELVPSKDKIAFQTFLQSEFNQINHFNLLKNSLREELKTNFKKISEEQLDAFIEILKYLDNQFLNDNNYSISASLAHQVLYAKHNLRTDILMYPSIQTKTKGVNMAIHPNFVDNKMKIVRFYIVELTKYDNDNGKFTIERDKYGYVDKNVIMWSDAKGERFEKGFAKDFSQYIE